MEEIKRLCDQIIIESQMLMQAKYKEGYDAGYDVGFIAGRKNYNNGSKLVIPFEDEMFGDVISLAVRQALQHPDSYMQLIRFLMPMLQFLSYKTLWIIEQDITSSTTKHKTAEVRKNWEKFLIHIRVQLNHKKP